jgi:hypothetical protein
VLARDRPLLLALGLLLITSAARADATAKIPGTNLSVRVHGSTLEVKRQRLVAPIPVEQDWPDLLIDVHATAQGDAITIAVETNCSGALTIHTTEAALRARLANVSALARHRRKDFDGAAAGFAAALALDPSLVSAALNLASAQARGGHRDQAITTLVHLAATAPRLVAWRVAVDPDLAALADAPALIALDAKVPGTATGPGLHRAGVAASAELGVYALVRTMGDLSDTGGSSEIVIVDGATGATIDRLSTLPGPALERGLRALGMATEGITTTALTRGDDHKAKGVLPGTHLGVVVAGGHARVVTGDTVLGEVALTDDEHDAWAARLPFGVLVASHVVIGEGCGGVDFDDTAIIPLSAAQLAPPAAPAPKPRPHR